MAPLALAVLLMAKLGADEDPERFLARARAAKKALERRACLETWAAVARPSDLELGRADLTEDERSALRAARRSGGLRVLADFEQGELRVRLSDPTGVAGRVLVLAGVEGESSTALPPVGPRVGDLAVYRVPSGFSGRVEIRVLSARCEPGSTLTRLERSLAGEEVPPKAPDPGRAARRMLGGATPEPLGGPLSRKGEEPSSEDSGFAWWWALGVLLAAAGVGLAAWEEARE